VAPFRVHLLSFASKEKGRGAKVKKMAEQIYGLLLEGGMEVLFDDREDRTAGEKLVEADLIGIPWRVVVSEKTVGQGSVEIKKRESKEAKLIKPNKLMEMVK